jgi:hypothetical protein
MRRPLELRRSPSAGWSCTGRRRRPTAPRSDEIMESRTVAAFAMTRSSRGIGQGGPYKLRGPPGAPVLAPAPDLSPAAIIGREARGVARSRPCSWGLSTGCLCCAMGCISLRRHLRMAELKVHQRSSRWPDGRLHVNIILRPHESAGRTGADPATAV